MSDDPDGEGNEHRPKRIEKLKANDGRAGETWEVVTVRPLHNLCHVLRHPIRDGVIDGGEDLGGGDGQDTWKNKVHQSLVDTLLVFFSRDLDRMSYEWPPDVEAKIVGIALATDVSQVVQEMKGRLTPLRKGSIQNAFFVANEGVPDIGWGTTKRTTTVAFPEVMKPFYESYPDDVEFGTDFGLIFMSESEIVQRSDIRGSIDLAFLYMGMGHVLVHSYVRARDVVITCVDGGANDFDRCLNAKRRREFVAAAVHGEIDVPMPNSWASITPFVQWWKRQQEPTWDL